MPFARSKMMSRRIWTGILLCCSLLVSASIGLVAQSSDFRQRDWSVPESDPTAGKTRHVWFQLCKSIDRVGSAEVNNKKVDTYDYYISYGYLDGPSGISYDAIAKY